MTQAKMKYFHDKDGVTLELNNPNRIKGVWYGYTDCNERVTVTRQVSVKLAPSEQVCDSRCLHAKGHKLSCECACGGLNHGKGDL